MTSEGSNRRGASSSVAFAEGEAEVEALVGPAEPLWNDLLSLTIMVRGREDLRLSLGVQDALGRVLTDSVQPEFSPNRALPGWGAAMLQVPVAPGSLPLHPPYKIKVRRLQGGLPAETLSLRVWTKHPLTPATVPLTQELLVQVINAGGVVDAAQLARALERARQIWRQAGIELIEDTRTGLDDHLQPEVARLVIDPALGSDSPALKKLLRLSSLALGSGLPLFLVQDIHLGTPGANQSQLWAVAGGIPVPPAESTERSGLAVSAQLLAQDPHFAGQIIAHEIGHALGLFHSTEATLQKGAGPVPMAIHDGFADTPNCPAQADSDGDGTLSSQECHAFDANNLMFWGTPRGSVVISPSQADVARRSMLSR